MARVLIETYGCTLNQADSDLMETRLVGEGYDVDREGAEDSGAYDYVIVNTCTVKQPTEQKILHRLGKLGDKGSHLVVAGCMASANSDRIRKVAPSASIVTTSNVTKIADALHQIGSGQRVTFDKYAVVDKVTGFMAKDSVIARIPVSEGCLSSCNFCETKFARGPLHSFSEELILKAIHMSVERGAREIQLASQDTGAYGLDKNTNIAELAIRASRLDGDFRIRIGMLNPEHLHRYFDQLVEALKQEKVYKFVHLPVQSGSDKVLEEMGRGYTIAEFKRYADALRAEVPGISIETDIIVGYPTENDEDFEASLRIVEDLKPVVINVSRFGARPHAKSARLKQLNNAVVKERSIRMHRVARRVEQERGAQCMGKRARLLITEHHNSSVSGRDDSYRQVGLVESKPALGTFIEAEIVGNSYACLLARHV